MVYFFFRITGQFPEAFQGRYPAPFLVYGTNDTLEHPDTFPDR